MGQATVDLPDPMNPPAVSAASTDDLLAQMAGEEIDRLLAESDDPPKAQQPDAPAASASAAPFIPTEPPADLRMPGAAAASSLDGVLSGIAKDAGPDPIAALASGTTPTAPETSRDPLGEDATQAAAERSALSTLASVDEAIRQPVVSEPKVSMLVRALAWLNSPMDSFSDDVRESIGKVAILTAVNSIAILAYVLIFRRH